MLNQDGMHWIIHQLVSNYFARGKQYAHIKGTKSIMESILCGVS